MKLNKKKINLILTIIESLLGKTLAKEHYNKENYECLKEATKVMFKSYPVKLSNEEFRIVTRMIKAIEDMLDGDSITSERALMLSRFMLGEVLKEFPTMRSVNFKMLHTYRKMFLNTEHKYYIEFHKANKTALFILINGYMNSIIFN